MSQFSSLVEKEIAKYSYVMVAALVIATKHVLVGWNETDGIITDIGSIH